MCTNDFQAELGVAIADLERIKLILLEVFTWGGRVGMIHPHERTEALMKIELARVAMPVIDIRLLAGMKQLGAESSHRITYRVDAAGSAENV